MSARTNYALRTQVMQSFPQAAGTRAQVDERPCGSR